MIVAGAGGHAKEVLGIFAQLNFSEQLYCFDDVNVEVSPLLFLDKFTVIKTEDKAKEIFNLQPDFVLGVGSPSARLAMSDKLVAAGGRLVSVVSPYARIGTYKLDFGIGLNIMTGAIITEDVSIGRGTLVNVNVAVHHDCQIGEFCELSPGCIVLGNVKIGDFSSIGAGAVLLPGITIGKYVKVGAGAVVTKNVKDGECVKGVPAK